MLSDVIAAIATPPGRSAIALIRISGSGAHQLTASVVPAFRREPFRSARLGRAVDPISGDTLDEILYVTYRAPASYTGEDMVELSTHGGLLVPPGVLGALLAAGARLATPGEFTRRALAHGKLDLLQAEAVGDLIDATAPAQRRAALHQLDRGLSRRIVALREQVLALEALVCYEIDFPEEDGGPVPPEQVVRATSTLLSSLQSLIGTASEGERVREGALCVIAGRPNAGKSSLFNALLGTERAIVTDVPGTTRDAIEAPASCDGFPFRMIDTAGLRVSDDTVERIGIEVSQRYLAAADVVLFCVEAGRSLADEEHAFLQGTKRPVLVVRTKADETGTGHSEEADGQLAVSAHTGEGLPDLKRALAREAFSSAATHDDVEPLVTRERHRVSLNRAHDEVREFADARASGLEAVVAATHLRAAVTALEDVIGVVSTDDILDRVFASFCVGK